MSYNNSQLKKDMLRKASKRPQLFLTGEKWGNSAWRFLYNVVLSYDGTPENLNMFITSLQHVLPCEECKKHYIQYIRRSPPPTQGWLLFQWLNDLENIIARKNYGSSYRYINRYEEIEKSGGTVYVETEEVSTQPSRKTIKKKKAPCHNCKERPGINRDSIPGLGSQLGNQRNLLNNGFFGRKI